MRLGYSKNVWPPVLHEAGSNRILVAGALGQRLTWFARPAFLNKPAHRTLFAGPWVGEFGWELLNWQAYLRALRPAYEHIIVSSRAGSEGLYADFCDEFIPHRIEGAPNCHVCFSQGVSEAVQELRGAVRQPVDWLQPLTYIPSDAQHFIQFGGVQERNGVEVLIHARGLEKVAGRNWPVEKWDQLIEEGGRRGWTFGAVGMKGSTFEVAGVQDYRGLPLSDLMQRLASAPLLLGPSSGPMHLASLCGTPHLVWTNQQTYAMGKSSRTKYETWWNPLNTPVKVLDEYEFDPPVDVVIDEADRLLTGNAAGG